MDSKPERIKFKSDENLALPTATDSLLSNSKSAEAVTTADIVEELKNFKPLPARFEPKYPGKFSPKFQPKFSPKFQPKFSPKFQPKFSPKFSPKFNVPPRSPVLEVKGRLTSTFDECLQNDNEQIAENDKVNSLSAKRWNADSVPIPFGRSRRMSRSLPELRDLQFVSVLPDVEEEESESSEFQGEEVIYEKKPGGPVPWHRKLEFLWASALQALGLSNIWRFPYYCYSNGGGSFVFPYMVFMVICSIPFLCIELAVGQITQSGPISAFGQLCPLMKGIGVSSMMLSFWLTAYYSVLTAWTLFYIFNSFYSPPRWLRCTNTWNSPICHDISISLPAVEGDLSSVNNTSRDVRNSSHPAVEFFNIKLLDKSNSIEESGELRFEVLASVVFVWILTYVALRKTSFFRSHVITILTPLLFISIFLRTMGLEGASSGLRMLFTPDWDKMVSPRVLLCALAQSFHSLSVVLGPGIVMGSCHKQHNNLLRDTIIVTAVTLLTTLIVGCISFATIGHLAAKLNRPFWSVINDDPGSVYIVYSVVIGSMPLQSCWGVIFFLMILYFGLDSEIKLMSTLVSALKEAYTYYIKQRFQGHLLFLAVICGFCFFASIPYLTQAGIYFFQLTDYYVAVIATIIVALFEICTLSWLYGIRNLTTCIQQMTGKSTSYFYQFTWVLLSPVTIMAILLYTVLSSDVPIIKKGYTYPTWAHALGWLLVGLTLCWIPILAVAAYKKAPKSHIHSRFKSTLQPRIRDNSGSAWTTKPVIILNDSDYKMPDYQADSNSVNIERSSDRTSETPF